jgi:hypothetical protein
MKRIFENVGGNKFKLLTEGVGEQVDLSKLVREGLKKVFSAGSSELSYRRVEGVGLGYIKSISDASKTALQEARVMAPRYGYEDDENNAKFVKTEDAHAESDMSNPEEKREVQIGREIIKLCQGTDANFPDIMELAKELIQMHGAK